MSLGEIVAHINLEIRLAIPVSELFRLFLQRHPNERQMIEGKSVTTSIDELSSLFNITLCQRCCAGSFSPVKRSSFPSHSFLLLPLYLYYAVDLSTKRVLEAAGNMDRARAVDAGTARTVQHIRVQYSTVHSDLKK